MRLGRLHGQKLQGFLSAFVTTAKGATWCSSLCSPPMLLTQFSIEIVLIIIIVFNGGLQWDQLADGPCNGRPGAHSSALHCRLEEQEEPEEQGGGWSGAAGGSWAGAAGDDWREAELPEQSRELAGAGGEDLHWGKALAGEKGRG